ncbi:LysR family transcriptional regulator [Humidisolicoccus flavus]|uniref:LysR family transcriptional regulator n=1 Tax=Humidisolicoccus flavus TaxID=3111414 RepID=UPI003254CADA
MDLARDQLRTLQAIIDLGSLDAAARSLHITPSAVSQRIKALESTIGRVVLSRTRPVSATPDGEHLVRLSRQIEALEYETRLALGEEDSPSRSHPLSHSG